MTMNHMRISSIFVLVGCVVIIAIFSQRGFRIHSSPQIVYTTPVSVGLDEILLAAKPAGSRVVFDFLTIGLESADYRCFSTVENHAGNSVKTGSVKEIKMFDCLHDLNNPRSRIEAGEHTDSFLWSYRNSTSSWVYLPTNWEAVAKYPDKYFEEIMDKIDRGDPVENLAKPSQGLNPDLKNKE